MIYSELVPRGKGEKHPGKGDEIDSEILCIQRVGALRGDRVLIGERTIELAVRRLVKGVIPEAIVKASLNRANLCRALDPKPSELPMDRLKFI